MLQIVDRGKYLKLHQMNLKHRKDVLTPIVASIEQRVGEYYEQFKAPIALSDLGRCHTSTLRRLGLLSFTHLLEYCKGCVVVSNRRARRFVAPREQRETALSAVLRAEPIPRGRDAQKQGFLAKLREFKGG